MIYDEMYENTGGCEHALYLGCRDCTTCVVDEYEEERDKELELQDEIEQARYEKEFEEIERIERARNKYLYERYRGIPLNRWNSGYILNDMIKYVNKKHKNAKIVQISYFGLQYVTFGIFIAYIENNEYIVRDEYF